MDNKVVHSLLVVNVAYVATQDATDQLGRIEWGRHSARRGVYGRSPDWQDVLCWRADWSTPSWLSM